MDIKDNEHVLDTNHYRRVVEEYEKNFMNGFTKEQQEEIKEMGKNVKIRNVSKQKIRKSKKAMPEKVKDILAGIALVAMFSVVFYGAFEAWAPADQYGQNKHPAVDIESVEDMSDLQRFNHWVSEQRKQGNDFNYDSNTYNMYLKYVLGQTEKNETLNPETGARK